MSEKIVTLNEEAIKGAPQQYRIRQHRSNIEFDESGARRKKTQYGAELRIGVDSSTSIKSTTHFANAHICTLILLMVVV